jgi:rhamnopyranosyl-N-acetylglucosaminyl-diphospho-decaprenol beta-1,3/1,4-galactofuranosyltransferase
MTSTLPDRPGVSRARFGDLWGVLVTFKRPQILETMLEALSHQTRAVDRLVVVDNAPSAQSERIVRRHADPRSVVCYLPSETNLGSIGGFALGLDRAVLDADADDWVVSLDDDDPPYADDLFERLAQFAQERALEDPSVGAVGVVGSRFDAARATSVRLDDSELHGPVPVDWLGQNQFAMYRVGAVRETGPYSKELFFGHGELEYGLRMRSAGFSLYAHGDLWRARRAELGRLGLEVSPGRSLEQPSWRRYYRLRNLIWILRANGRSSTAAQVTLVRGLAKPLASVATTPRLAIGHLKMNVRASIDGWTNRLGPRAQPEMRIGPKPGREGPR